MNQKSTSAPIAENKMGTMPVGKLVLNMSLPMMISMLVQALYNIVDSVFVAMLSENALTAVSMAFPLQTLLIAVGAGTGVGMNALLSKSLGEKNFEKANRTASNAAFLYGLSYLVFLILGFTVVKPFYASQVHNADPEILKFGVEYLSTVMMFSFGLLGQFFFEASAHIYGKNHLQHDFPAVRCHHQHHPGSDPDLWSSWCSENGCYRSCRGYCDRTVCSLHRCRNLQP